MNMNVTIVGGGNIGMCLLGEISRLKRYDVTIYASNTENFESYIKVVDDEKNITYKSGSYRVTDNCVEAVKDADVILCTYPAFLRKKFIEQSQEYIKNSCYIGFFPGYGGAEFFCDKLIKKGVTIFGLQKAPYVSRTKQRGKVAGLMSKKSRILIGTIPKCKNQEIIDLLTDMLMIEVIGLPNYMSATLLPGNPLLHTAGSYIYLKEYINGEVLPNQIFYYQSWTNECSEFLCSMSDEMRQICDNIPIDLSNVQTIQEYYESPTPEALTQKFHSIPSFYPLVLPMKKTSNGYLPDFSSRFYTEDIPYGICILKALSLLVNIKTPNIDLVLDWYNRMTGKKYYEPDDSFSVDINETAIPQLFGFNNVEDLVKFYDR